MNHDQYEEQAIQLLDGELSEDDSITLHTHLSTCKECRGFLQSLITLRSCLAENQLSVPTSADKRLHQLLVGQHYSKIPALPRQWWNRQVPMRLPVVALLFCLIAAGVLLSIFKQAPFHKPETVYITRLPAVIVTNEPVLSKPKN